MRALAFPPRLRLTLALLALAAALAPSCATPIGVRRSRPESVYHSLNAHALENGSPSFFTRQILERHDLHDRFEEDREGTLRLLHEIACRELDQDYLFALSELCYLTAVDAGRRELHLAAVAYAFLFLFDPTFTGEDAVYDPRFRIACDLYNASLMEFLRDGAEPESVILKEGTFELFFGTIAIRSTKANFPLGGEEFTRFVPSTDFELRGLRVRNRRPGLGAPLIAARKALPAQDSLQAFLAPNAKVAATVVLKLADFKRSGERGERWELAGLLELWDPLRTSRIKVGEATVPLEADLSAPIAYTLQESSIWRFELAGLFSSEFEDFPPGLYFAEPYSPEKIPLVLVHGTASSPARWAELCNGLAAYPLLRARYQVWLFLYSTGNPIPYSAALLRKALVDARRAVDPEGKAAALAEMVVMGHSQGGLLSKLLVVDSGSSFWDQLSAKGLDPSRLSTEDQQLLRDCLVIERLPFVKRVVFLATPHGGSFQAGRWYSKLASSFISFPRRIITLGKDLVQSNQSIAEQLGSVPSSIDNMDPESPFLAILRALPIPPAVEAHSIVPVKGDGPIADGNDGVVEYKSAHLEGVRSEFVLRCGHSCQSHPLTIVEVRRILLEHLQAAGAPAAASSL